jgi:hypothetical protein
VTWFGSTAGLTRVLRGSGAAETNAVPAALRYLVLTGILLVQFLCTSSSTIVATSAPARRSPDPHQGGIGRNRATMRLRYQMMAVDESREWHASLW